MSQEERLEAIETLKIIELVEGEPTKVTTIGGHLHPKLERALV